MGILGFFKKSNKSDKTTEQPEISALARAVIDELQIYDPDAYIDLKKIVDLENKPKGPDRITAGTGMYFTKAFHIFGTDYEMVVDGKGKEEFWKTAESIWDKNELNYMLTRGSPTPEEQAIFAACQRDQAKLNSTNKEPEM